MVFECRFFLLHTALVSNALFIISFRHCYFMSGKMFRCYWRLKKHQQWFYMIKAVVANVTHFPTCWCVSNVVYMSPLERYSPLKWWLTWRGLRNDFRVDLVTLLLKEKVFIRSHDIDQMCKHFQSLHRLRRLSRLNH